MNLTHEERGAVNMALGRIFRMMLRPNQPGDAVEYERCRALILNTVEAYPSCIEPIHNYARDRNRGAQGDR